MSDYIEISEIKTVISINEQQVVIEVSDAVNIHRDGNQELFFQKSMLLSELDSKEKRDQAIINIGLATIDGGEFFTATP